MSEMRLVNRAEMQAYMNCTLLDAPAYHLIGEGFTDLSESKNPQEYSRKYVHERSERSDVVGYSPSISYTFDVYTQNPVQQEIMAITDGELVGNATHRDIVVVHLFEPGKAEGTCVAYQRTYAVIPDGKGDGEDALVYTGSMKASGEVVKGTFSLTAKTFVADGAEGA